MTENHSRWIIPNFDFRHCPSWVLLVPTLVLLSAPWAAAQGENFPPPPPWGGHPSDNKIKVRPTMTIVLICLVSSFIVMACVSVYIRQCVERHMVQNFTLEADGVGASRRSRRRGLARGLDPAVVDAFPTFVYSEVRGLKLGKGELECAVCLNEFDDDDETLRLLPKCSHVFHPDCIDAWLSSHITCPVCRANLVPKPGETRPVTVLSHDAENENESPHNHDSHNQNLDRVDDDLIIPVQSPEVNNTLQPPNQNNPPRKEGAGGKLRRSYSTGDWLVQPGENCERFTLRLPEEVKKRLVNSSLSRTKSCVVFQRASSSKKGFRSSSGGTRLGRNFFYERFDREGRTERRGFFSRAGSARLPKAVGDGEESTATQKTLVKSVTLPLHRLLGGADNNINVGERSFDRLVPGQI